MAQTVRVAAVGLGWVALHRHLPVMDRHPGFQVVGVIDRSPGLAAKVARERRYGRFAQAATLGEVPWLDEVDAITVATAPMGHFAMISEALSRGKHVLTEKPFAMTVAEGETLVASAEAADRRLAIVHNFQFARSTRKLLAEIESGQLGRIRSIAAIQLGNPGRRLPTWYEELPLGLFYDESPHLIYLMRRIAGPMALTRAFTVAGSEGQTTPARIDAYFTADRLDCPVTLHCNFESPVSEWGLMVFGEHRLGIVDVFRDIYISLPNDGAHDTSKVLRTSLIASAQHWAQHIASGVPHLRGRLFYGNDEVFDRFTRAIGGESSALAPIDGTKALEVLKLQHAILARQESIYAR